MNHTTDPVTMSRGAISEKKLAETPRQLLLPGFERSTHGVMPNDINRSSLFAPIARGRRKKHWQARMVTRADCIIEYTGEQLDEADCDILMALFHFAQPHPIGEPVYVQGSHLLRFMGRRDGLTDYRWLLRRLRVMKEATLWLEGRRKDGSVRYQTGKLFGFNIIRYFEYDMEARAYVFELDSRWVSIFANNYFSLIDWQKRLQIGRGRDMAKALQRLVATDADSPQRYGLAWLKEKMAYSGRDRDFRAALGRACGELERLDIIARWRIEESKKGGEQLTLYVQHEHRNQLAPRGA